MAKPEPTSERAASEPVADDAPVEIRLMRPGDAPSAIEAFVRAYGDSYEHRWAYHPEEFALRLTNGVMVSAVAVDPADEIVGHLGVDFDRPEAKVGDSAHAVVDPRYRGHHVFESMKTFMAGWAAKDGMYGLFSDATAAHPYSQRGNLALGAHETGFLLGSIRGGIDYKGIDGASASRRLTTATFYLRTNPEPTRVSHAPEAVGALLGQVYANGGFDRGVRTEHPVPEGRARIEVGEVSDNDTVVLTAVDAGPDLHAVAARHLEATIARGVEVIYLDLPLGEPATSSVDVADLGFFFGGVIPELRDDGDVLRLQRLNGVEPHVGEIATASEFGHGLLADIAASIPD